MRCACCDGPFVWPIKFVDGKILCGECAYPCPNVGFITPQNQARQDRITRAIAADNAASYSSAAADKDAKRKVAKKKAAKHKKRA